MNSDKPIIKEYKRGDLTIIWEPAKCIHSGICAHMLPEVYDPKGKPWIKPDNATAIALKKQIDQCPSGALSYKVDGEPEGELVKEDLIKVNARMNGSLLIEGNIEVTKPDGSIEIRNGRATFCRCGDSANMPFCDGAHKRNGFTG